MIEKRGEGEGGVQGEPVVRSVSWSRHARAMHHPQGNLHNGGFVVGGMDVRTAVKDFS